MRKEAAAAQEDWGQGESAPVGKYLAPQTPSIGCVRQGRAWGTFTIGHVDFGQSCCQHTRYHEGDSGTFACKEPQAG